LRDLQPAMLQFLPWALWDNDVRFRDLGTRYLPDIAMADRRE
jgi:hypothetical protein